MWDSFRTIGANSGIKEVENTGEVGNVGFGVGTISMQYGKLSDRRGVSKVVSIELPKLDVAGSIPVARSNIFER